jgi:hypothetical protein
MDQSNVLFLIIAYYNLSQDVILSLTVTYALVILLTLFMSSTDPYATATTCNDMT